MSYNMTEIRAKASKLSGFMSKREVKIMYRAIKEATFIIDNNATLRETAKHFGEVTKSTVQLDVSVRLWNWFPELAREISDILFVNYEEALMRATCAKQEKLRKQKNAI